MMDNNKTQLDESLYSRQIYVLGHEAMNRMRNSNVLISGLNGVGLELAKCIILGGVKSVTLHDEKNTSLLDLSSQSYLSTSDIGKNRTVCTSKLKELNPYVSVTATTQDLRSVITSNNFDVIVVTDHKFLELIAINKLTREKNAKFIACITYGAFGFVFCDFGDNFVVNDPDGEEIKSGIVVDIYYTGKDKIIIHTAEPHGLTEGDSVMVTHFSKELVVNDVEDIRKFVVKYSHNLGETLVPLSKSSFQQIKYPKVLKFKEFGEILTSNDDFVITDITDFTRPNTLHAVFQAIDRFTVKHNRLPKLWNDKDAKKLCMFTKQIYPEANDEIVRKLSYTLQGKICALDSIIGSIGAQEVMKASSSKFHPIKQWFYYDIVSNLPKEKPLLSKIKDRYYGQRLIFGDEFQKKLSDSKVFVIGSGAIGCEHLKNFAMIGIGNLVVTDMDTIEKSNLNRQFLFRMADIGKFKSDVAAREVRKMNPLISVTNFQHKVCQETETIFDEKFFESLTCVTNALDNVQARLYVDERCVLYHKSLIESGTLGTKGNVQVIIPHLTESYGSAKDPVEQSIPVCTLKNFPYAIEHCIELSRDLFEGYFVQAPTNTIKYLTDKNSLRGMTPTEIINIVKDIKQVLNHKPNSYSDCIKYAYEEWHELFRNQILQLLHNFPPDKICNGIPFWSGSKKCPTALFFDIKNELHINFIRSFANLWADIFGIKYGTDKLILNVIRKLVPSKFVVDTGAKISATDEEEKERMKILNDNYNNNEELIDSLKYDDIVKKIKPLIFEKDDDSNFHIDFITSTSNLRATNYEIKPADRHKTKGIAGKIIPAIATTTSLISSLVTLELYKIIDGCNELSKFKNSFVNLAIPYYSSSEPFPSKKYKIGNKIFTFWDSIKFNNVKLSEIIKHYKVQYDVEVDDITVGQARFYSNFLSTKKRNERLNKTVTEIYSEISDTKPTVPIVLTCLSDGNDIPSCKIYY